MILSATDTQSAGAGKLGDQNTQTDPTPKKSDSLEDNFLLMLTTELKNQDPNNPMDSSQMVAQLSQISTTQGISDLKSLMQTEIMTQIGSQRLASSQLIGKNVDYKACNVGVNDNTTTYSGSVQESDPDVKTVNIKITDSSGKVVKTLAVNRGSDGDFDWQWDGKDETGARVANGSYGIAAATDDASSKDQPVVFMKDTVSRVDFSNDGSTKLIFADGQTANLSDVDSVET